MRTLTVKHLVYFFAHFPVGTGSLPVPAAPGWHWHWRGRQWHPNEHALMQWRPATTRD